MLLYSQFLLKHNTTNHQGIANTELLGPPSQLLLCMFRLKPRNWCSNLFSGDPDDPSNRNTHRNIRISFLNGRITFRAHSKHLPSLLKSKCLCYPQSGWIKRRVTQHWGFWGSLLQGVVENKEEVKKTETLRFVGDLNRYSCENQALKLKTHLRVPSSHKMLLVSTSSHQKTS